MKCLFFLVFIFSLNSLVLASEQILPVDGISKQIDVEGTKMKEFEHWQEGLKSSPIHDLLKKSAFLEGIFESLELLSGSPDANINEILDFQVPSLIEKIKNHEAFKENLLKFEFRTNRLEKSKSLFLWIHLNDENEYFISSNLNPKIYHISDNLLENLLEELNAKTFVSKAGSMPYEVLDTLLANEKDEHLSEIAYDSGYEMPCEEK